MTEDDPLLTPDEELRIDNALKALNLELNHGGVTHFSDELPPEVVNQWLANVTAFEEQFKTAPKTTVYEMMGKPKYASLDLLDASTLVGEANRVEKMLLDHGVVVPKPEKIDYEEYYRFLIEDIFEHEMSATSLEGMITVLEYESFYPELHEFIRDFANRVLLDLLNLTKTFEGGYFSQSLRDDTSIITLEQVMKTITDFRNSYSEIVPIAFQAEQMMGDPSCLYLMFGVKWEGVLKSSQLKEAHEGLGVMQFAQENKEWTLQGIQMPGFKF